MISVVTLTDRVDLYRFHPLLVQVVGPIINHAQLRGNKKENSLLGNL